MFSTDKVLSLVFLGFLYSKENKDSQCTLGRLNGTLTQGTKTLNNGTELKRFFHRYCDTDRQLSSSRGKIYGVKRKVIITPRRVHYYFTEPIINSTKVNISFKLLDLRGVYITFFLTSDSDKIIFQVLNTQLEVYEYHTGTEGPAKQKFFDLAFTPEAGDVYDMTFEIGNEDIRVFDGNSQYNYSCYEECFPINHIVSSSAISVHDIYVTKREDTDEGENASSNEAA